MRRSSSFWLLAVVWIGLWGCGDRQERLPHVVIVSIDTLNRNALRAYQPSAGPLPALDAFAEGCIRFSSAFTTAPWTLPAHASLLTGLYPDRHAATDQSTTMSDAVVTLGTALQARGYQTVAFTDGGYLDRGYGFGRGFEFYDGWSEPGASVSSRSLPNRGKPSRRLGRALFARAIAFLSQRPPDAPPLFLFLHTFTVHNYFQLNPWASARVEGVPSREAEEYQACLKGEARCSERDWGDLQSWYRAEVEWMSQRFGRLVDALERAGIWQRSVVLFLSDHGEGFAPERGRIHHGGRLHNDQIQIPLLVRVPGQEGRDEPTPVSLVDLMPSILELADAPEKPGLDGRSFAGLLHGRRDSRPRALYAMDHYYWWEGGERRMASSPRARPIAIAVVQGERWYIRDGGGEELYDMDADPGQLRNLAGDGEALSPLRRLASERVRDRPDSATIEEDESLRESLRSLGYLE